MTTLVDAQDVQALASMAASIDNDRGGQLMAHTCRWLARLAASIDNDRGGQLMTLSKLPGTKGTAVSIDDEIEKMEQLVEDNKVEHIVQVMVEKPMLEDKTGALLKVHVMTMGTPLKLVRDYLQVALQSVEDMIGKKP